MAVKQRYQVTTDEQVLYNFEDAVTGTGYITLYAATSNISGTTGHVLTNDSATYSADIEEIYLVQASDAFTQGPKDTHTFELSSFNNPQTIRGTAIVQNGMYVGSSAGETSEGFIRYSILEEHEGIITELGSATTETLSPAGASSESQIVLLEIPLITTPLSTDSIIQLKVEVYASGTGTGGTGEVVFGSDPMNRDGTYITAANDDITQLKLNLPFKINR